MIWKLEKLALIAGPIGILVLLSPHATNPLENSAGPETLWVQFASLILVIGLTVFPFYVFSVASRFAGKKNASAAISYARLVLAVCIALVSWWLYYKSGLAVTGNKSSTASLIFAVLPFYILVGGGLLYAVLALVASADA